MRWRQIIISPPARTPTCNCCKTRSTKNCGQNCSAALRRAGEKSCLLMVHAPQQAPCNGRCRLRVRLPRSSDTALTPSPARSVLTLAQTLPVPRGRQSLPPQMARLPLPMALIVLGRQLRLLHSNRPRRRAGNTVRPLFVHLRHHRSAGAGGRGYRICRAYRAGDGKPSASGGEN